MTYYNTVIYYLQIHSRGKNIYSYKFSVHIMI